MHAAIDAGARGWLDDAAAPRFLAKAVRAVARGEAWVPRRLPHLCVDVDVRTSASRPEYPPECRGVLGDRRDLCEDHRGSPEMVASLRRVPRAVIATAIFTALTLRSEAGMRLCHHVHADVRGKQGIGLRAWGQRLHIDHLWLAPSQGLLRLALSPGRAS